MTLNVGQFTYDASQRTIENLDLLSNVQLIRGRRIERRRDVMRSGQSHSRGVIHGNDGGRGWRAGGTPMNRQSMPSGGSQRMMSPLAYRGPGPQINHQKPPKSYSALVPRSYPDTTPQTPMAAWIERSAPVRCTHENEKIQKQTGNCGSRRLFAVLFWEAICQSMLTLTFASPTTVAFSSSPMPRNVSSKRLPDLASLEART